MMKRLLLSALVGTWIGSANAQQTLNLGGDISMLPQYEKAGTPYYGTGTTKIVPLTYMKRTCKMNSMRVRLYVNPSPTADDPTLVQDLDYVTALGKRIKEADMDFMLDFHYSDSWADPSNQTIPAAWVDMSNAALTEKVYSYTKECLAHMKEQGATPDFVQIGNEVSYGMLWRNTADRCYSNASASTWKRFTDLLSAAAKAVREETPNAKIVLHIERSGDSNAATNFFTRMNTNGVDYDIIGLSYYPFWHKNLATLGATLNTLEAKFPDKPVQIVETAYYYQSFPESSDYENTTGTWAATPEGQQAFVEDLCKELAKHNNVTGLYYWFPEENGSGNQTTVLKTWINRGLWNNQTHQINPAIRSLQNFLTEKEAVGINNVRVTDMPDGDHTIYTLSGQRVTSMLMPGIYVKGKKKLVVR